MLAVLMGGRSAEEIFLGHITTGAGNDIERATEIARNMVCEWGMSTLGPLAFGKKDEAIFLGREITQHRDYSEDTAIQIDKEVKRIVSEGYDKARAVLQQQQGNSGAYRAGAAGSRSDRRLGSAVADGEQAAAGETAYSASTAPAGRAQRGSQAGAARVAAGAGLYARRKSRESIRLSR